MSKGVLASTEVAVESFTDAMGNEVYVGDEVYYVLGDRSSKRIIKGVVVGIGNNPERYYGKLRVYIRTTFDRRPINDESRISPMEVTERIVKI